MVSCHSCSSGINRWSDSHTNTPLHAFSKLLSSSPLSPKIQSELKFHLPCSNLDWVSGLSFSCASFSRKKFLSGISEERTKTRRQLEISIKNSDIILNYMCENFQPLGHSVLGGSQSWLWSSPGTEKRIPSKEAFVLPTQKGTTWMSGQRNCGSLGSAGQLVGPANRKVPCLINHWGT